MFLVLYLAGPCFVCGSPAEMMCSECHKQEFKPNTSYYFCARCTTIWHENPLRQGHKPVRRQSSSDAGRLQLLSVLCIETSHYVCFTRVTGSGKDEWVFFDSMAERPGNYVFSTVAIKLKGIALENFHVHV